MIERQSIGFKAVLVSFALFWTAQPLAALEQISDFGSNPGELQMFVHRPAAPRPGMPMVVALHGCTLSAEKFDDETGLVALAEETPFLLVLPQQREENMSRLCFRWHDTDDNQAGQGESASILQMIETAIAAEDVDPARVFVMGLSAGGGMTAVLLANYPDRFAGGAIIAGPPYGCNRPASAFDFIWNWIHYNPFAIDGADAAYACGLFSAVTTDREPDEWAQFVLDAAQTTPDDWPLVSIWQGDADDVVDPDNLEELTEQWTAVHGIDLQVDDQQTVGAATRRVYADDAGNPRVETWDVQDLGHSVPVDTDGIPAACGQEADFITHIDLCAVRRIADFWQLR